MRCLYCDGELAGAISHLEDLRFGVRGSFAMSSCLDCEALIADPLPSEETIGSYYESYYTHEELSQPPKVLQRLWPLPGRRRLVGLAQTFYESQGRGRALEIGCGAGERLVALSRQGWAVVGQDMDPSAGRVALALGLEVRTGALAEVGLRQGDFDLVAMAHVLEHASDPGRLLREAWSYVADGGTLTVICPTSTGFGRQVLGRYWVSYHAPFHLGIPGVQSIELLARRNEIPPGHTEVNVLHGDVIVATSLETLFARARLSGRLFYAIRVLLGIAGQAIAVMSLRMDNRKGTEVVWTARKDSQLRAR